jgi:hypothetical protein
MDLLQIQEALKTDVKVLDSAGMLFAEARDAKLWKEVQTSENFQDGLAELKENAARYLQQPLQSLPYSLFKLFRETGSRKEYEAAYFEHRARLITFAILALAEETPEIIGALEDTIWGICEEYTWSLPAHLDDNRNICQGNFRTSQNLSLEEKMAQHRGTLDLFACETGFALAEILSLLENKLSPLVVSRGRQELFQRILGPYSDLKSAWWWETATMNWAAVCGGSIGAVALYVIEDQRILALVLQRVLGALEYFLKGFGEDGACLEGLDYWNYGFGFYTYFGALLKQRTAGKIDLFQGEKIKRIALFPQKCYLEGNSVVSFSDSQLTVKYEPGLTGYLKSLFQEITIPERRFAVGMNNDLRYRWASASRNIIWDNSVIRDNGVIGDNIQKEQPAQIGSTCYFENAEWLISKKYRNGTPVYFAAKGGHNDEPHNHNDVGSFLFQVAGETLLVDMGSGEYTRQYFGAERYDYLCNSSRGHSVPIVDGQYQKAGRDYAARIIDFKTSAQEDILSMDIGGAYGDQNLKSLQRKFVFGKDTSPDLVLTDQYEFEKIPTTVIERFCTFYPPQIISEGKVRLQEVKSKVDLLLKGTLAHPEIVEDSFINHEGLKQKVYFIDFIFQPTTTKITAEIVFEEVQA